MVELYKFFNSTAEDPRTYQATDFADYFGSVLSTGLLHTDNVPGMRARVIPGTLRTSVTAGKAIMEGHLYENTSTLELTHDLPETTADRIDRVVLRLNLENAERNIKLHVIKGTPSGNPAAPTLRRDNFVYEISLARVRVRANTVQLLPEDLYDERLVNTVAGLSHSLISIPTEQFQDQWDRFMEAVQDDGFTPMVTHNQHVASGTAHGIGDKAALLTENKNTLVEAINEAFQSASNGKTLIKNAVTGVDPLVTFPSNPTFQQLAQGIGSIRMGYELTPGDKKIYEASAYMPITASSYSKMNELTINAAGTVRVSLNLNIGSATSGSNNAVFAKVYINNTPAGMERSIPATQYTSVTFTEDFPVKAGDKIQIFAYRTGLSSNNFGLTGPVVSVSKLLIN